MGDEKMDKTIMIELSNTFKDAVSDVDVPSPNRAVARIDPGKVKEIMQFLLDNGFDHLLHTTICRIWYYSPVFLSHDLFLKFNETLQKGFGSWRTTGNINIHREYFIKMRDCTI